MQIFFNKVTNNNDNIQITFGKRADVICKSLQLCDEFAKEKLKNPNFTYERINKLIKKNFPKLKIKYWNRRVQGFEGRFEPCNYTVCLFKNNLKKENTANQFLITVIHELTHAYQDSDAEMSCINIIKKYANKKGDNKLLKISNYINDEANKIIDKIFIKTRKLTTTSSKAKTLQHNTLPEIKKYMSDYILNFQNKIKSNPKYDKYDKKYIIQKLYYILVSEFDAYKISNEFLPKINRKIDKFDTTVIDLIKTAYTTLEKHLKQF